MDSRSYCMCGLTAAEKPALTRLAENAEKDDDDE